MAAQKLSRRWMDQDSVTHLAITLMKQRASKDTFGITEAVIAGGEVTGEPKDKPYFQGIEREP